MSETNFQHLIYETSGSVAIIKLNRPEVMNSLNVKMLKELYNAFVSSAENSSVRAILISGEGKAFCAGQDLADAAKLIMNTDTRIEELVTQYYNPLIKIIRAIPKPVVCGVNGSAVGAGAGIVIGCDIVLASYEAYFSFAFSKIGLVPDCGSTYFLPRLIGHHRATAHMLLGDKINAQEAKELGLVYKLYSSSDFFEKGLEFTRELASLPTTALGLTKQLLNKSLSNSLEEQIIQEAVSQEQAGQTFDFKEGVAAFLEKRLPNFKGN